ncbi:uncharacterized protein TM35_000451170 [Trypanosoma theileri]|uniref:Mucin TcMUCII n=1 Tax=Trypanosoma theileri TaxID=67003 RepID=A0A1X0NJM8_9TRYP|nr:uncharacterized protein TM35_000451170 [Trypanosoma theileri]ORC84379.1 hypothetical protein TM35_000451170 [Trypanosoma theileri]
MPRCNLHCFLTLALCCACGLVWAQDTESTRTEGTPIAVCFPPLVSTVIRNGSKTLETCINPNTVEKQENEKSSTTSKDQSQQGERPIESELPPGEQQTANGENTASSGSSATDGQVSSATAPQNSSENSSHNSPSQNATESGTEESGVTSSTNGAENTESTTTTTTTLPPESTNNKKGDADSSSSISSSVWVRVPLLIVVTLSCILVC